MAQTAAKKARMVTRQWPAVRAMVPCAGKGGRGVHTRVGRVKGYRKNPLSPAWRQQLRCAEVSPCVLCSRS